MDRIGHFDLKGMEGSHVFGSDGNPGLGRGQAAEAKSRRRCGDQTQGEAIIAEARQRAQEEIAGLTRETDEAGKAAAQTLADQSEREREALRAGAKAKEEEAISFVVERIVSS